MTGAHRTGEQFRATMAVLFSYFNYQKMPKAQTTKIVCEYDQEIPQSQTAAKFMVPRVKATTSPRYYVEETQNTNSHNTLNACEDPESFVRGGPTFFCLMREE